MDPLILHIVHPGKLDLHPVILHFPIVLLWTAFVYDLLGWIWKFRVYPAGHWILIAAALMAIPTVITGLIAADDQPPYPDIPIHRNLALATLAYSLIHAAFRFFLIYRKKSLKPFIFVLLSFFNVLLVTITAEYGGRVAFGQGVFTTPPPEEPPHHHHDDD